MFATHTARGVVPHHSGGERLARNKEGLEDGVRNNITQLQAVLNQPVDGSESLSRILEPRQRVDKECPHQSPMI
jgi:hypothetical protein